MSKARAQSTHRKNRRHPVKPRVVTVRMFFDYSVITGYHYHSQYISL